MSTQPKYIRVALHMARAENFSTLLPRIPTGSELAGRALRTRAAVLFVLFTAILLSMPAWSATLTPVVYPKSKAIASAHLAFGAVPPATAANYRMSTSAYTQLIETRVDANALSLDEIAHQAVIEHVTWLSDRKIAIRIQELIRIALPKLSEEDIYPIYMAAAVDPKDRTLLRRWMKLFSALENSTQTSAVSVFRFEARTKLGSSTGLVIIDRSTREIGTSALTRFK